MLAHTNTLYIHDIMFVIGATSSAAPDQTEGEFTDASATIPATEAKADGGRGGGRGRGARRSVRGGRRGGLGAGRA